MARQGRRILRDLEEDGVQVIFGQRFPTETSGMNGFVGLRANKDTKQWLIFDVGLKPGTVLEALFLALAKDHDFDKKQDRRRSKFADAYGKKKAATLVDDLRAEISGAAGRDPHALR